MCIITRVRLQKLKRFFPENAPRPALVFFLACIAIATYLAAASAMRHFLIIFSPYQVEFREGATLVVTDVLLRGQNPFDLQVQPEASSVYGIVYPLVVYPFAKIFGSSLILHRLVSAFSILGICVLLFQTMRNYQIPLIWAGISMALMYRILVFSVNSIARPDALGCLLFLSAVLLPRRSNFSTKSLIVCSVLGVLAWLTKAYFLLALPYVGIYLFLFVSKKKGVWFVLGTILLWAFVALLVNEIFECYFYNTHYINYIVSISNLAHRRAVIAAFENMHAGLLLGAALAAGYLLFEFWLRLKSGPPARLSLEWKKPLLPVSFDYSFFCAILSTLFLFQSSKRPSTFLTYHFQLLSPFLILGTFSLFARGLRATTVGSVLVLLNLILLIPRGSDLDFSPSRGWKDVDQIVAAHSEVFNSPSVVSILVNQRKRVWDSGLTQYFVIAADLPDPLLGWLRARMKPTPEQVRQRVHEFQAEIREKVDQKSFDLIILNGGRETFLKRSEIANNYQRNDEIVIPMATDPTGQWLADIWKPRD